MASVGEGDRMVEICATLSAVEDIERSFTITLIMHTGDHTGNIVPYKGSESSSAFSSSSKF